MVQKRISFSEYSPKAKDSINVNFCWSTLHSAFLAFSENSLNWEGQLIRNALRYSITEMDVTLFQGVTKLMRFCDICHFVRGLFDESAPN
jgi:hypothetical protein